MNSELENYDVIFWDFDGVIKNSVEAKSLAFKTLFEPYGKELVSRVIKHHQSNGGLSRYKKIPVYLSWIDKKTDIADLSYFLDKFSELAIKKVICSSWVPGILEYLEKNYLTQDFYLITATPQKEIEYILSNLGIRYFFKRIIGSPTEKKDAISNFLESYTSREYKIVMIGDSVHDRDAAEKNNIDFILRKTKYNLSLQQEFEGLQIQDFN